MNAKRSKSVPVSSIPNKSLIQTKNIVEYLRENQSSEDYILKCKNFGSTLLSPETKDELLVTWLKQFKDNILFLDRRNEEIAGYLLRLDWTRRGSKVVSVYQKFMLNVVSAHPYYLHHVLEMLMKLFTTGDDGTDYVTIKEKELFSKGHHLLKGIIDLIPLSPAILCKMLVKNYPYAKIKTHVQVCYVTNVLEICKYLPSDRHAIMENLIIKLLHIDVLCPRHEIEMDEMDNSDTEEKTFAMDCDESLTNEKEDHMSNPLAKTLDILMDYLIQHINSVCLKPDGKGLDWESTKKMFKEILAIFDKVILPTNGSTHMQFIIFYLCNLKQDLHDAFIDYLWKKVQNPNTAPILRRTAVFYIGSFLARAAYIPVSTVAVCLELMCRWIHQYIETQCYRNYADVSAHGTFYAVCQTVFYVFAFHHKKLIEMKNGLKSLRNLNFERIISCRLNPLRVCLPAIVQNFASVTRSYQLAYCYTVIERNNRNLISRVVQTADGSTEAVNIAVLQTLFPFDPYLLKCSRKWIKPLYHVYPTEESEEMDEQDEDLMLEDCNSSSPRKQSYTNYGSSLSTRPLYSPPTS